MAAALREWSRAAVRTYLLLAACLLLLRVAQVALAGSEAVAVAVAGAVVRHAGDTLLVPFIFVHRAVRGGFELHAEATNATSKVTGISHGVAQGLVTVFFCAFASAAVRSAPAAQQVASRAKAWVESQSLGLTPADVVAFWGGASGSNRALLVGLSTALGTLLIPLLARNSHGLFALGASIGLATALAYLPNVLGTLLSSILTDFVLGGYPLTFGRVIPVLFMSKGRLHALVDVTDFAFGNPPGFPNPYFVHAKHVQVSMSCSAVRLAEFAYHCAVHGWAQVHTMSPEGDAQPHEHNVPHAIGDEEDDGNGDGVDDDFKRTIDGMNNPETIAKLTKLQARFRGISSRKLSSRLRSEYEDGEEEHAYAIHTGKSRPVGPVTPSETLMRQARRKLTVKIQRIEVNGAAVNFETHKGELNVCVLSRMLGEAEMRRLGRLPPGPLPNQLMVRVARAAGLRPADTNGLSDPYVTLRVRELVARTQVCQETLSPVWDRTFILPVDDVSAVLELDVIDKDVITADDVLGTWVMPLKRLCLDHDNAHCKGWFPLLNNDRLNDGRNGQLFLEVHWRYAPADDPSWKSALPKSARLPTPLEQITFNSRETSRRIGNFLIARRWLKLFPIHIEWEMFVLRRAHVYITDLFRGRKGSTGALRVNWLDSEPQKQEGRQSDTVKVKRLELNSRDLRGSNNTGILSLWDALYSFSLGVLPKVVGVKAISSLQMALVRGVFGSRSEDGAADAGTAGGPSFVVRMSKRAQSIVGSIQDSFAMAKTAITQARHYAGSSPKRRQSQSLQEKIDAYDDDAHHLETKTGIVDMRKPRGTCAWRIRFVELKEGKLHYSGVSKRQSETLVQGSVPRQLWTRTIDLADCMHCAYDFNSGVLTLNMGGESKPGPVLLRGSRSSRAMKIEGDPPDLQEWVPLVEMFRRVRNLPSEPPPLSDAQMSVAEELRQKLLSSYDSSGDDTEDGQTETTAV